MTAFHPGYPMPPFPPPPPPPPPPDPAVLGIFGPKKSIPPAPKGGGAKKQIPPGKGKGGGGKGGGKKSIGLGGVDLWSFAVYATVWSGLLLIAAMTPLVTP